jgi:predicted nucleic acid-binding protein
MAVLVTPHQRLAVLEDEPDNRLLEAALEADADFVVTGDKRVCWGAERPQVVTSYAFLQRLDAEFR